MHSAPPHSSYSTFERASNLTRPHRRRFQVARPHARTLASRYGSAFFSDESASTQSTRKRPGQSWLCPDGVRVMTFVTSFVKTVSLWPWTVWTLTNNGTLIGHVLLSRDTLWPCWHAWRQLLVTSSVELVETWWLDTGACWLTKGWGFYCCTLARCKLGRFRPGDRQEQLMWSVWVVFHQ